MSSLLHSTKHLNETQQHNYSQTLSKPGGTHANSSYETSITLIPNSHKDSTRKENYTSILLVHISVKELNKNYETESSHMYKKHYTSLPSGTYLKNARVV